MRVFPSMNMIVAGVVTIAAAGLLMNAGRNLPVIKQARKGFA